MPRLAKLTGYSEFSHSLDPKWSFNLIRIFHNILSLYVRDTLKLSQSKNNKTGNTNKWIYGEVTMRKTRPLYGVRAILFSCICALTLTTLSAKAALVSRLGGQAYYDTVLDITWLADMNLAASNTFGLPYNTDLGDYPGDTYAISYYELIDTTGSMTWGAAYHWIDAMNAASYLGVNDWRLPALLDTGNPGCDFAYSGTDCGWNVQTGSAATTVYSEVASLWYDTLNNTPQYTPTGVNPEYNGQQNVGPFSNLQVNDYYWSGPDYTPTNSSAWRFQFRNGFQGFGSKNSYHYVWAVRSGDVGVASAPVPASIWLFGSGLLGLIGISRHKKKA